MMTLQGDAKFPKWFFTCHRGIFENLNWNRTWKIPKQSLFCALYSNNKVTSKNAARIQKSITEGRPWNKPKKKEDNDHGKYKNKN